MDSMTERPLPTTTPVDLSDFSDLPPEFCHFPDIGCEVAFSCLGCPYDKCLEEGRRAKELMARQLRDIEISNMCNGDPDKVDGIATWLELSPRTVRRAAGLEEPRRRRRRFQHISTHAHQTGVARRMARRRALHRSR